jgi:pyruvate,water dikinase
MAGLAMGKKATALRELTRAGMQVPEFAVVTAESEPILDLIRQIGFPLAVRSSASVEDSAELTFAGQFESYLNLRSIEEVQTAVRKCFDSARSPRVIAYCRLHGSQPIVPQMSVIVQRMVEPELSGVAFTVCPNTGREEIVVEACEGLADRLIQGEASPLPADHPLLQKHLPQIKAAALQIQRQFGQPQDIEFAIAGNLLYILQSRPITKIEFAASDEEWTSANFREGGVSSGVCSPLMWSLYEFIWDRSLKQSLRELRLFRREFVAGRMIFGRPYWNLAAVKRAVAAIPGYVEREFDEDLCIEAAYEGDGSRTPVTARTVLSAIPTLLALPGYFRRQEQNAERLLGEFDALLAPWESAAADCGDGGFRQLIERDYWRVESTYFRTIFAVSLAKLEFKKLFPGCDYAALMSALPPLRHLSPLRHLRSLAAPRERDAAELAAAFRHHCRWGVDIRHPRWDEDLEFVVGLLKGFEPMADRDARPDYERAHAEALARLPWWKRPLFARKLARLRRLVWLREELRDLSGRMYYVIRRKILGIARKRGLGDDIFFQTFQEIYADERSNSASGLRREIEARREIFESYRNFQPPVVIGRGSRYAPERLAGGLQGIGASGGTAAGLACLAGNPAEALTADKGSILICPFVEPGWTPVVGRVAGLVTEIGGRLSHAAVICRELGIPAVLGVPQAMRRIRAGQRVTIDGSRGLVEVQEAAASAATPPA